MEDIENRSIFTKGNVLMADASSDKISVFIAKEGSKIAEATLLGGALENLFLATKKALKIANLKLENISSFGFCRGTGSILGIRILSTSIASLKVVRPQALFFTWTLLDVYAELAKRKYAGDFSIICQSRKGYVNVYSRFEGSFAKAEIPAEKIQDLAKPLLFINQKSLVDKTIEGSTEIYFSLSEIFELFKLDPSHAKQLENGEIADALVLAKREYVKWNFQAHT